MTENELRSRLKDMYHDIPEEAHQALMRTPYSGEEQPVVKRKLTLTPVLVLVIILVLASVAYAVTYYSVRELNWSDPTNPAYEEHIININQRYENDAIAISVNDAGFDGQNFAVAMNLEAKNEGEYVYIRPILTAQSGGVEYYCDVDSIYNLDFMTGFVYPDVHHEEYNNGNTGFSGCLMSMDDEEIMPTGPVEWTLTLKVYRALFDVVKDNTVITGDEGEIEAYREKCLEAYRNQQLLVTDNGNLIEYEASIQEATGIPDEEYWNADYPNNLVTAGVLEQIDTIVCQFTSNFEDKASQKAVIGQKVSFEDFDIVADIMNVTFHTVTYSFHLETDGVNTSAEKEDLAERLPKYWELRINGGITGSHMVRNYGVDLGDTDDKTVMKFSGQDEYSLADGNDAETITFMPYEGEWNNVEKYLPQYAFTIDLENGTMYVGEAQ